MRGGDDSTPPTLRPATATATELGHTVRTALAISFVTEHDVTAQTAERTCDHTVTRSHFDGTSR